MLKVMALKADGSLSMCSAPADKRGEGRCNHIAHQNEEQSTADFIESVNNMVTRDSGNSEDLPDYSPAINRLVGSYGQSDNPNWSEKVKSLKNPFHIGSEKDGSYEEAELVDVKETIVGNGELTHVELVYKFRGEEHSVDFGEFPVVHEDGTINLNGANWRVLPVMEQFKAGVISHDRNIVVKQANGHVAFSMPKDLPEGTEQYVRILGKPVELDRLHDYLKNGEDGNLHGLTGAQQLAIDNIDPVAYHRFGGSKETFAEELYKMKDLPSDEPGDFEWRKVMNYETIAGKQMEMSLDRMGNTFRTNLGKQGKSVESGYMSVSEANLRYPLFTQSTLTDNVREDLISRSNVQLAENLNPIAALSQSQKISLTGPGGYNKDQAPGALRMPHPSQTPFSDKMDTSSGHSVGLTVNIGKGFVGEDGFVHARSEDGNVSVTPSDFIPYRLNDDPVRAVMAVAHMKQACPIKGGEDPIIKTPAWENINGAKIGTNLRIAYLPSADVFEDAVVISESAAERMATIQAQRYNSKSTSGLEVGQKVTRRSNIGGVRVAHDGIITKVTANGFEVESEFAMGVGDKLAGRHGNKSVVSRVVPDSEMPRIIENGKQVPAQVIMSPMSVVNRKNLGQVMETNEAAGRGAKTDATTRVVLPNGTSVEATAGTQYIMRLNHIAEKTLSSYTDEVANDGDVVGTRLGEMESILLSSSPDRLKILAELRHQTQRPAHNHLNSLLKSVGVQIDGVNWKPSWNNPLVNN